MPALGHLVAEGLQHGDQDPPDHLVVIHHQDPGALAVLRPALVLILLPDLTLNRGEDDPEFRADPDLAPDLEITAVPGDDAVAAGQSETVPGLLGGEGREVAG